MFIRSITVKGKKYYRMVESYRADGKVKQRCIASLCSEYAFEYTYAGQDDFMVDYVTDLLIDNGKVPGGNKLSEKAKRAVAEAMAETMVSDFLSRQILKQATAKK